MSEDFFKFPSTPHLTAPSGVDVRDDKVLTRQERDEFLQHDLVVEEKVDGANLGISFDSKGNIQAQNRGSYLHLPGSSQWKKLDTWLSSRTDRFFECLHDRYILFGEWCYVQHSISYNHLPDWFLGFDLYDKQVGKFLSTVRRDNIFDRLDIAKVPVVESGRFTYSKLENLPLKSQFSDQSAEGLYLRYEAEGWLVQRTKLVRPGFVQSIGEHWSRSAIKPNRLGWARA